MAALIMSGNWLEYWQRKLPVRDVLVGKPKGRSIKGLRDRVDKLHSRSSTRSEGAALQEYLKAVTIAHEMRGGAGVQGVSQEVLESKIAMLDHYIKVYPAELAQHLLERRRHVFKAEQSWEQYVRVLLPWGDLKFHARTPTMASLPRVLGWKIRCFFKCVFEEAFCPLLYAGQGGAAVACNFCRDALTVLEAQDPLDLADDSATCLSDSLLCFRAAEAILSLPFSSTLLTACTDLAAQQGPSMASRPQTIVFAAIKSTPYLENRRSTLLQAAGTILQHEQSVADLRSNMSVWANTLGDDQHDRGMAEACEALAQITKALPTSALAKDSEHLNTIVVDHIEAALEAQPSDERLKALCNLSLSATISFPLCARVGDLVSKVAVKKQCSRDKAVIDGVQQVLSAAARACDEQNPASTDAFQNLQKTLDKSNEEDALRGLIERSQDTAKVCTAIFMSVVDSLPDPDGDPSKPLAIAQAFNRFLPATSIICKISEVLSLVCSLTKMRRELDSTEAWGGDAGKGQIQQMRLSLVRAKSMASLAADHIVADDVGMCKIVATVQAAAQHIIDEVDTLNKRILDAAVTGSQVLLRETMTALKSVAYGCTEDRAWSAKLAATASWDALVERASTTLARVDKAGLRAKIEAANDANAKLTNSLEQRGDVVDEATAFGDLPAFLARLHTTISEVSLLDHFTADPPLSREDLRASVRPIVRSLREDGKVTEKDALHPAMFKRTFQALLTA